jgi:NAD-dependent SIR2 family protein deacetylase
MDVSERLARKGIYIPPSAQIHGKPPKWSCNFCGETFTEDEARKRDLHMARHAKKDADDIREIAARRREGQDRIFGEGDPEKSEYLKRRHAQLDGKVENPLDPKHY